MWGGGGGGGGGGGEMAGHQREREREGEGGREQRLYTVHDKTRVWYGLGVLLRHISEG